MRGLIKQVGPCTWTHEPDDPFALIVRCIIGQQISGKAAAAIHGRLTETLGRAGITPRRLAKLADDQFQACGISGPKRRAIRAVTEFMLANPRFLRGIPTMPDDELREQLVSIKGIGPWTVDMFLMFGLGRPDVLSAPDYGIRVGIKNLFGLPDLPKPKELERIAEPWRPHRSVAMWYVWRSLELNKNK